MKVGKAAHERPWISLAVFFTCWKALLLLVAAATPGPGYDTSTQILFYGIGRTNHGWQLHETVVARVTRWDAIYFTSGARYGDVFEQEWAFSWAFKKLIYLLVHGRLGGAAGGLWLTPVSSRLAESSAELRAFCIGGHRRLYRRALGRCLRPVRAHPDHCPR